MKRFQTCLSRIINKLKNWKKKNKSLLKLEQEIAFNNYKVKIFTGKKIDYARLTKSEKLLISRLIDLFAFKHRIGSINELLINELDKTYLGKYIGFLGPLGVGKSTIANILIHDLRADLVIREPYTENPFWRNSQTDPSYMFRSQIYFLLSNIYTDIRARLYQGRSVSDTSALTDSLMWVEWYRQTGHLNNGEYKLYQAVLGLLEEIIPKPDLLVAVVPNNIEHLKQGIIKRQTAETVRAGELVFTSSKSKDLALQTKIVKSLIVSIPKRWQVQVLGILVDPLEIYNNPSINYDYVYQIRSRLGLLAELLTPSPEKVVTEIRNILAEATKGQIIIIHAKSMFTGKTTVLCQLAEKVGVRKIIAFQPRAAVRWLNQEIAIVSRDGSKVQAKLIEDNSLKSILELVRQRRISSKKIPYLLIDEIMLFSKEAENHEDAIKVLEKLRKMGFHVIVDGIDYTFQEKPFTFMHKLLKETNKKNKNWHALEMSTRCRYCDNVAIGTRRIKEGQIADYNDIVYLAGDKEQYEPVCCQEHKSCVGQPSNFVRQKLPV